MLYLEAVGHASSWPCRSSAPSSAQAASSPPASSPTALGRRSPSALRRPDRRLQRLRADAARRRHARAGRLHPDRLHPARPVLRPGGRRADRQLRAAVPLHRRRAHLGPRLAHRRRIRAAGRARPVGELRARLRQPVPAVGRGRHPRGALDQPQARGAATEPVAARPVGALPQPARRSASITPGPGPARHLGQEGGQFGGEQPGVDAGGAVAGGRFGLAGIM